VSPVTFRDRAGADVAAYDLYSKSDAPPQVSELKPYYMSLINKYFPEELDW
jgi:hypothetical protein